MKIEFLSEHRLRPSGWVFLGAVAVAVGMMTVFGYLAGTMIVQEWGELEGPRPAAEAQDVGALALIEGVLVVLLIALAVAFSRTASKKMNHQGAKTPRKIRRFQGVETPPERFTGSFSPTQPL